jgi:hypothetical protein
MQKIYKTLLIVSLIISVTIVMTLFLSETCHVIILRAVLTGVLLIIFGINIFLIRFLVKKINFNSQKYYKKIYENKREGLSIYQRNLVSYLLPILINSVIYLSATFLIWLGIMKLIKAEFVFFIGIVVLSLIILITITTIIAKIIQYYCKK